MKVLFSRQGCQGQSMQRCIHKVIPQCGASQSCTRSRQSHACMYAKQIGNSARMGGELGGTSTSGAREAWSGVAEEHTPLSSVQIPGDLRDVGLREAWNRSQQAKCCEFQSIDGATATIHPRNSRLRRKGRVACRRDWHKPAPRPRSVIGLLSSNAHLEVSFPLRPLARNEELCDRRQCRL